MQDNFLASIVYLIDDFCKDFEPAWTKTLAEFLSSTQLF